MFFLVNQLFLKISTGNVDGTMYQFHILVPFSFKFYHKTGMKQGMHLQINRFIHAFLLRLVLIFVELSDNIKRSLLAESNLIFCCTCPTDPNFWKIKKMIILTSYTNNFFHIGTIFLISFSFRFK